MLKHLAVRRWDAEMLRLCFEPTEEHTTLFTGIKKDAPGARRG